MTAAAPGPSVACIEPAFCDPESVEQAWTRAGALAGDAVALEERAEDSGRALVALVALLGARGLLDLTIPAADGGAFEGVRSVALCLARERLGYASPLVELAFAMQGLGGYAIVRRASQTLRGAWLPRIASGDAVAGFALTEEEAGSDLSSIATSATFDPARDEYVLEGAKTFISNAGIADVYTFFAATGPMGAPRRLSAFVLPADVPGLTTRPLEVLGGHPIGAIELDGVRIPSANRLGAEGDGLAIALEVLHKFRPTVGAAALGFAQRALDESVAHVKTRRQFGAPLAELQAVQLAVADMACELESARLLVYRAAAATDAASSAAPDRASEERSRTARMGSMAKLAATEAASRIVDRAIQLHGGRGVLATSAVARLYQDVRALRIYEGASDVQRLLIAREVLR